MTDYRITIRLLSPLGTPWQSDTVFGHLCWQVAHGAGGLTIQEFLEPFRQGRPPFVLSDGFPGDLLPRPLLPVPRAPEEDPSAYEAIRRREKARFVTQADFQAMRRGELRQWQPAKDPWVVYEMPHAAINRVTNTTGGGEDDESAGRFFTTELLVLGDTRIHGDRLSLYLRAEDPWGERVPEILQRMAPLGFGRDRSTGSGAFEVLSAEPWDGFHPVPNANAFISLSSFCPAREDPTWGRWRVRLKYGKLGEHGGSGNPFKRPLIQFEPGAVFLCRPDGAPCSPRPYYGRLVPDIAPGMPEAVQGCFTLAVPCSVPNEALELF